MTEPHLIADRGRPTPDEPTFRSMSPALVDPPVVEFTLCRELERRTARRSLARHATVTGHGPGWVDLHVTVDRDVAWPGMATFGFGPDTLPEPVRARLEVTGGALRFRMGATLDAPGAAAPSPMLVADPTPDAAVVPRISATSVELDLRDGDTVARLDLTTMALTVTDRDGTERAAVGGPEKNRFAPWDAWSTGISRTSRDTPLAHEVWALRAGEAIWGFGEQYTRFDRVGSTIDLIMEEGLGTGTTRAYKNIPFWISSHGYGLFLHTTAPVTAWVGSRSAHDLQVAIDDDGLDWFLFPGTPREVLAGYTELTGRAALPPRWSFGFWQSKISYGSAAEVLDVVDRLRAADLPVDVIHVDTNWFRQDWRCDLEFDPERFPDPAGLCDALADRGVHLSLWQLPYIPEGCELFDRLAAVDGFVRRADGALYDIGVCITQGFAGRVGLVDVTNPAALDIWTGRLRELLELGLSVIKVDFGEQAPYDGVWFDGTPGHLMHNRYPLLYNRAVAEATAAVHPWSSIWARSAWAGSQRYPIHWGGDNHPTWASTGPQLAGGLGLGLCGFSFWSFDIGGFSGWTEGEQLIRSLQGGLFVSHPRIHGAGRRELDAFGDPVTAIARTYLHLRMRLLPYLWGAARTAAASGLPMASALCLTWPEDPSTWPIGDQWLLGDALLVAPLHDPTGRRRTYLPAGRWVDWWTGEAVDAGDGGRWVEGRWGLDTSPLWLRAGHPVALGPVQSHVDARPIDRLTVRVAVPSGDSLVHADVPVDDDRVVHLVQGRSGSRSWLEVHDAPDGLTVEGEVAGGGTVELVR